MKHRSTKAFLERNEHDNHVIVVNRKAVIQKCQRLQRRRGIRSSRSGEGDVGKIKVVQHIYHTRACILTDVHGHVIKNILA